MTDDRNDTGPRRRLGLPGQARPGEHLETVFRDELPDPADAAVPGYPLTRADEPDAFAARPDRAPEEDGDGGTGPEHGAEPVSPAAAALPSPSRESALPAQPTAARGPSARVPGEVPPSEPGLRPPAEPAPAPAAGPEPEARPEVPLRAALEAVLMVVDEPVTVARLAEVLERPKKLVAEALDGLAAEYDAQERGFELRFVAGGWRFYTRAVCAPVVDRFVLDGQQSRLTQAALETLAVIAYRQPVSRSRVSAVRGVNCDGVMRTLVQRGLVEESGTEPETGAFLYRTTHYFLERMGLRGLDELPELAPFLPEADDVEADSQEGSAITEAIAEAVAAVD